ncbi:hypothetical protein MTR67_009664 [Solanum verrucosum]|uniref:Uncharacterized protein n=2 Tax=Solanum verrucosum TaxID=315347 RepID=A0AAF0QAA0_SOLVR|nr:hypothetical protein MTR67_009664 [Solanum verrucosum]
MLPSRERFMASDGPSWADQWGAGGIGAMDEDDSYYKSSKDSENNKKATTSSSSGIGKVKAVAVAGAHKVKNGPSMLIKWVRSKSQKKNSSIS